MATQTLIEKASGSPSAISLPVLVWDDAYAALDPSDAISAAATAGGGSYEGVPLTDASFEQLSEWAWRITLQYGLTQLTTLLQQRRANISIQAETLELTWATPVARYPGTAADLKGTLFDGERLGVSVPPGAQTDSVSLEITIASFTSAYLGFIKDACRAGVVNSGTVKGHAAGSLQLVSFAATQTSTTVYQATYGYSHRKNVSGASRGDVTGIAHLGHEHAMNYVEPFVDRDENVIGRRLKAVYVTRPRPLLDFTTLSPSGYDVLPDTIS